jgi:clan AA aspartic protease
VEVEGPAGTRALDAVIDTGFNGKLTLPRNEIVALDLPEATVMEVTLADGRVRDVQMYVATVRLDGHSHDVLIAASPVTPLLGTGLLWGFSLYVEFAADGRVDLHPLAEDTS